MEYQTFGNTDSTTNEPPILQQSANELPAVNTLQNKEIYETNTSEAPILFLDVNFGKGNITRIVMYENDTPEELAYAFCLEHKLDEEKKKKLIVIIKKHLESVLDRIIENSSEEDYSISQI